MSATYIANVLPFHIDFDAMPLRGRGKFTIDFGPRPSSHKRRPGRDGTGSWEKD